MDYINASGVGLQGGGPKIGQQRRRTHSQLGIMAPAKHGADPPSVVAKTIPGYGFATIGGIWMLIMVVIIIGA